LRVDAGEVVDVAEGVDLAVASAVGEGAVAGGRCGESEAGVADVSGEFFM
jgi:hypothetical protein